MHGCSYVGVSDLSDLACFCAGRSCSTSAGKAAEGTAVYHGMPLFIEITHLFDIVWINCYWHSYPFVEIT